MGLHSWAGCYACRALKEIADDKSLKDIVAHAGVFPPLFETLRQTAGETQESAVMLLRCLLLEVENHHLALRVEGLDRLRDILNRVADTGTEAAKQSAWGILHTLELHAPGGRR
jgi:hypothetical protein